MRATASATSPRREEQREHRRVHTRWLMFPLGMVLILWLWLFYMEGALRNGPNGRTLGADLAMFLGAATVLQTGGNPYYPPNVYQAESRMLRLQGLEITAQRQIVRVGNPPLYLWALEPLLGRPFSAVALAWIAFLALMSATGFVAIAHHMGIRHWPAALLLFLGMPQTVYGPFFGNPVPIVLAGIGLSLALQRRFPSIAGALLAVGWLKPPVALPLAMLIILFTPEVRRELLVGFVVATAGYFGMTVVVLGPHVLTMWLHGLGRYSKDISVQPNVTSLAGLYVHWMPAPLRTLAEGVSLSFALLATGLWFWHTREQREIPLASYAWLWALWFLATPYAHFYDEILLTVPTLALFVGSRPRWVSLTAAYVLVFSVLLLSWTPLNVCLLCLPVVMVTMFAGGLHPRPLQQAGVAT